VSNQIQGNVASGLGWSRSGRIVCDLSIFDLSIYLSDTILRPHFATSWVKNLLSVKSFPKTVEKECKGSIYDTRSGLQARLPTKRF
jgi:hypothetical protein